MKIKYKNISLNYFKKYTKMEKLPKDVLINVIFPKLPSEDILNLCRKSREMSELCISEKANSLWIKRIREEFNVNYLGQDAIFEYLSLKIKNVWIVHQIYNTLERDFYLNHIKVFRKLNDAIKYVESIDKKPSDLFKSSEELYILKNFMIRSFKIE